MELLRSGLQLVAIKGLETCEGSVNVPVSNLVKRTILKIRYSFYQVNITIYKV